MRFRKGESRSNKVRWKNKMIEKVKKFKYLGYTLEENGGEREN